ncbi:unnamed protein product [Rhizophagus irregularis]|nr:unnamed protein product [Rhizophagus irregularis]
MDIRDSEQIYNDYYEIQEDMDDSYIHVDPLTTSLQQIKHNEISNDLVDNIIGLYRLLDLCNDDDSNGIVDKIIISKEQLRKLCNDMVPSSFKSISEINYTKLNSISIRLIGCYGNRNLIAKLMLNRNIINQQIYDLLTATVSIDDINKPSLRPGIYLLKVNSNLGLIIHWPEIECYANSLSATKRNMVNLHRCLTKLTDHQMCFMSDEDLENFNFNLENTDTDTDDDDDTDDEYEVKKCQKEREDFKIDDGFKVNLSNRIKAEINNQMEDDIPLHPIVVESTTNQSFVTRQLIKKTSSEVTASFVIKEEFPTDLNIKLQDHYLRIDRKKMDMKALKLFIKYGLKMENLLDPLQEAITAAKKRNDTRKNREYDVIVEDIEIIKRIASIKLRAFESYFGKYIVQESPNQINISNEDLKRIQIKYPGIENQIEEKIKIDSRKWKKMKKRYNLTCIVINNMLEKINETENNDEMTKSAIKTFHDMFNDDEISSKQLLEKYTQKTQQSKLNWVSDWIFGDSDIKDIKKAKQKTNDKSDVEFIQELVNFELFEGHDNIKENIINTFIKEYHNWKKEIPNKLRVIFPNTQYNKQLEDNFGREFEKEKEETEKYMFEKICDEIENKYKNGQVF